MAIFCIPLFCLALRKRMKKIKKIPETHESHETQETHMTLLGQGLKPSASRWCSMAGLKTQTSGNSGRLHQRGNFVAVGQSQGPRLQ
jgi:hypothetical protein